jgi:hypothetical protein
MNYLPQLALKCDPSDLCLPVARSTHVSHCCPARVDILVVLKHNQGTWTSQKGFKPNLRVPDRPKGVSEFSGT